MVLLKNRVEFVCCFVEERSLNLSSFFIDDIDVHKASFSFHVLVVSLLSFLSDSCSDLPV